MEAGLSSDGQEGEEREPEAREPELDLVAVERYEEIDLPRLVQMWFYGNRSEVRHLVIPAIPYLRKPLCGAKVFNGRIAGPLEGHMPVCQLCLNVLGGSRSAGHPPKQVKPKRDRWLGKADPREQEQAKFRWRAIQRQQAINRYWSRRAKGETE